MEFYIVSDHDLLSGRDLLFLDITVKTIISNQMLNVLFLKNYRKDLDGFSILFWFEAPSSIYTLI